MKYETLCSIFRKYEESRPRTHLAARICFTEDSFTDPYSEESRTYEISSDNKAFQPNMGGYSIYGSSLDRSDMGVRLEAVMADEKGGPDGWKIENCVLLGFELIRTVEREIHQPMFFKTRKEAEDAMFLQFMRMAELLDNPSEINAPMSNEEQKRLVKLRQEIRESDEFETENGGCSETMAWVNDASGGNNWDWKIFEYPIELPDMF